MITGAVIAVVCLMIGFIVGRIQFVGQPTKEVQSSVCGCKHHKSYHSKKGCVHLVDNPNYNSYAYSGPKSMKQIECNCQQYTGPEGIEDIYRTLASAPPIIERNNNA